MLNKIKYWLWYLFFSVYWTAHELGEKEKPHENAKYYLILTIALNIFGIFEILLFYGFYLNAYLVVFGAALVGIIITNRFFFRKNVFVSKLPEFSSLQEKSYKFKRYKLLIFVALWTICFVAFGGVIRMK